LLGPYPVKLHVVKEIAKKDTGEIPKKKATHVKDEFYIPCIYIKMSRRWNFLRG
jgi:hypothetical protein